MNAKQARALTGLGHAVAQPNNWQQQRYEAIMQCRAAGISYAEIGAALGVTRQAVSQYVRAHQNREKGAA